MSTIVDFYSNLEQAKKIPMIDFRAWDRARQRYGHTVNVEWLAYEITRNPHHECDHQKGICCSIIEI